MNPNVAILILRGYRLMQIGSRRDYHGFRIFHPNHKEYGVALGWGFVLGELGWMEVGTDVISRYVEEPWESLPTEMAKALDLDDPFFN